MVIIFWRVYKLYQAVPAWYEILERSTKGKKFFKIKN